MTKPYAIMENREIASLLDHWEPAEDGHLYLPEDLYFTVEFMLKELAGGAGSVIVDKWNPDRPTVMYWKERMLRIQEDG